MTEDLKKQKEEARKKKNADILRRMRAGESLTSFDSHLSWYPVRPKIEKDQKEIDRLFNDGAADDAESKSKTLKIVK